MTAYPPPYAGVYVVRPPGQHPARNVRALTALVIECIETAPFMWGIVPPSGSAAD
jgi:hypothetical protein